MELGKTNKTTPKREDQQKQTYEQMGFPLGTRNDESPPTVEIHIDLRFRFTSQSISSPQLEPEATYALQPSGT